MILEAVIFDMDGVLLDSEPIHRTVDEHIYARLGIDPSLELRHQFVGMGLKAVWHLLKDEFELPQSVEELVRLDHEIRYRSFSTYPITPTLGLIPLLNDLKFNNVHLAVASSSSLELIKSNVTRLGLTSYFDVLVSGTMVPNGKPAPDIFQFAAARLEVNPEHCVVIEDSDNGLLAARRADMVGIGYANPTTFGQTLEAAQKVCAHFAELNTVMLNDLIAVPISRLFG